MNLKGKQKRYLRAQAHDMRPLFQIGKDGLDENWLNQVIDAIDKHWLKKMKQLSTFKHTVKYKLYKRLAAYWFYINVQANRKIANILVKLLNFK